MSGGALDDVGRAENNLKNLVAENREAPIWRVAIVPSESVELAPPQVALDDAMQYALKSRPELSSSDVAREINEIEQRFAREQARPQVDLIASYGMVGLAGPQTSSKANASSRKPVRSVMVTTGKAGTRAARHSIACGISGANSLGGLGCSFMCLTSVSIGELPTKGGRPATIS